MMLPRSFNEMVAFLRDDTTSLFVLPRRQIIVWTATDEISNFLQRWMIDVFLKIDVLTKPRQLVPELS